MFDLNTRTQASETKFNDYQQAEYALEIGDYERAAWIMTNRIKNDETDFNALIGLARACLRLGQRVEARAAIDQALAYRPQSDYAHAVNGLVLAVEARLDRAETELALALKTDPTGSRNYFFMAQFMLDYRGDLEAARRYGLRAIEMYANHAEYHALMGRLFEAEGQPAIALLAYRKALDLSPHSGPIQSAYAALIAAEVQADSTTRPVRANGLERQNRRLKIQRLYNNEAAF